MSRFKFTLEVLNEILGKDGASTIKKYNSVKGGTLIECICKCGKEFNKKLDTMYRYGGGAKCEDCVKEQRLIKFKSNLIDKYGVDNISKLETVKLKKKETVIKNFGVSHPSKSPLVKKKCIETITKKYGIVDSSITNISQIAEIKEKKKNKAQEKYGVDYTFAAPEIKKKIKEVLIAKYGVENPMQNILVQEKAHKTANSFKTYKFPNGDTRKVQGFEPFALNILSKIYSPEQIITERGKVPRFKFEYEGKTKYYHPDIYIPSANKIIEVKSTWTYKCKNEIIRIKADAVKSTEYEYEIWIFDAKGNRVDL